MSLFWKFTVTSVFAATLIVVRLKARLAAETFSVTAPTGPAGGFVLVGGGGGTAVGVLGTTVGGLGVAALTSGVGGDVVATIGWSAGVTEGSAAMCGVLEGGAVEVGITRVAAGVAAGGAVDSGVAGAVSGSPSFAGELPGSGVAEPPHATSSSSIPAAKKCLVFKDSIVADRS